MTDKEAVEAMVKLYIEAGWIITRDSAGSIQLRKPKVKEKEEDNG